jgi:hypothetical protein
LEYYMGWITWYGDGWKHTIVTPFGTLFHPLLKAFLYEFHRM